MRKLATFASMLLLCLAAQAQDGAPTVSQLPPETLTISPGKTATVKLTFRVAGDFHINSHKPLDELLLPTALSVSPPTEIMVSRITYPEGQLLSFPFSPESKMSVYSGDFVVTALVRAARDMPKGTFRVHGELKFQACNNRQCFPPKKLPVFFDVHVVKPKH